MGNGLPEFRRVTRSADHFGGRPILGEVFFLRHFGDTFFSTFVVAVVGNRFDRLIPARFFFAGPAD
jgi:hypothetical protein